LESVNITLSSASKVQDFIAQYLTIYQMSVDNTEVINMPMFMDTFLKDDFTKSEREKTAQFIFLLWGRVNINHLFLLQIMKRP